MAVLSDTERFNAWADYMRDGIIQSAGITKQDLRAAINAADDWIDGNANSFNVAIPQPARNSLTAAEKAAIIMYVTARRYGVEV